MIKHKILVTTTLAIGLGFAASVNAKVFTYDINNPDGGDDAGDITNFQTSYDDSSEQLNWQSTVHKANGNLANGIWLVLSDGADPLAQHNEYAIFYGDSFTGNLSAYVYNGINSGSSWNAPGEFIQSFGNVFESDHSVADQVTFSFSADISSLNNYVPTTPGINDWDGAQYDENIGVWYHPVLFDKAPNYNADGSLASFPEIVSGFYDAFHQLTVAAPSAPEPAVPGVPEPGTLALTSLGLIVMFAGRRRRLR